MAVTTSRAPARPLALEGWLPGWDIERRHTDLDEVAGWAVKRLREWGVVLDSLSTIEVSGARARALSRRLTQTSLSPELRRPLHAALRRLIPELAWERVLVQTYAHFRILVPGDTIAPVPPHVDVGFGHGLDERNLWLALTETTGDGALHLCGLRESLAHLMTTGQVAGVLPDPGDLRPVPVQRGDALLFTPLHLHAARAPIGRARVSLDLRLIPARGITDYSFSPLWSLR